MTADAPTAEPSAAAEAEAIQVNEAASGSDAVEVRKGDSLWSISRRLRGKGVDYSEIYARNAARIRDPRKIYPGQRILVPKGVGPD